MLKLINGKYNNGEIKNISFLYNFYNQKGSYGYGYGYGNYNNGYYDEGAKKVNFLNKIKNIFKKK